MKKNGTGKKTRKIRHERTETTQRHKKVLRTRNKKNAPVGRRSRNERTPAHLCRRQASKRILVSSFHAVYEHPQRPDILCFVRGNVAFALEHCSRDFWSHVSEVIEVRKFSPYLTARKQGNQLQPLLFVSCEKKISRFAQNALFMGSVMCKLIVFDV